MLKDGSGEGRLRGISDLSLESQASTLGKHSLTLTISTDHFRGGTMFSDYPLTLSRCGLRLGRPKDNRKSGPTRKVPVEEWSKSIEMLISRILIPILKKGLPSRKPFLQRVF